MITSVFDFTDYREFLNTWIENQKTKGLKGRLAEAMNISSTMMSLILKGDKHLSLEQAAEACDFFGFKDKESEYFFLIVEYGKAGTHKLQQKLKLRITEQQNEARKISKRLKKDKELSEEEKAVFYSSWMYSGIRNLSALEQYHDVASIAARLNIPIANANQVIEFLVANGLCKFDNNRLTYGPAYTHIASDSPYVIKHHQNWRLRGMQAMDITDDKNLYYTCPMSLSKQTAEEIRAMLVSFIQEAWKKIGPSASEEVYCFNIDWFKY